MWGDNIMFITSALTLLLSIISCMTTIRNYFQEIQRKKVEVEKLRIELRLLEKELNEKKNEDVGSCLKRLTDLIEEIYPKSNANISVKLVRKSDKSNPSNSEVITWVTYPKKKHNIQAIQKIKENTDFNSIVKDSREYFFVSDLKKYSALKTYSNAEKHFIQEYSTSIVVPIQKENKETEDIIGFLCITSPQKLGNVKKNKKLVDIIKTSASLLYDYLIENKQKQEAITINK